MLCKGVKTSRCGKVKGVSGGHLEGRGVRVTEGRGEVCVNVCTHV